MPISFEPCALDAARTASHVSLKPSIYRFKERHLMKFLSRSQVSGSMELEAGNPIWAIIRMFALLQPSYFWVVICWRFGAKHFRLRRRRAWIVDRRRASTFLDRGLTIGLNGNIPRRKIPFSQLAISSPIPIELRISRFAVRGYGIYRT